MERLTFYIMFFCKHFGVEKSVIMYHAIFKVFFSTFKNFSLNKLIWKCKQDLPIMSFYRDTSSQIYYHRTIKVIFMLFSNSYLAKIEYIIPDRLFWSLEKVGGREEVGLRYKNLNKTYLNLLWFKLVLIQ